jgi:hypothetical protein
MKKMVIMIMIAFIPAIMIAQGTPLTAVYDKYDNAEDFTAIELNPAAMSFEWASDSTLDQVKEMMKSIEMIRILNYNSEEEEKAGEKIWKKMQKAASDELYTEVLIVNADDIRLQVYMIKGVGGKTSEVAILGKYEERIIMATMTGNMDFSQMLSEANMKNFAEMAAYFMEHKGFCEHKEVH